MTLTQEAHIPRQRGNAMLVKEWSYKSLTGEPLGYVGRYEPCPPNGTKEVLPFFKRDADGWAIGGPMTPRPLYGLDWLTHQPEATVFIVEGEKATAALHQLGFPAVTSLGGSNAVSQTDWSPLQGRSAVLLPDNDEAGTKYARDVLEELAKHGVEVSVCELDNLPPKGDAVDWIQARIDWDGYSSLSIFDAWPVLIPEFRDTVESRSVSAGEWLAEDWPEPAELPDPKLPVMPFDFELLPDALRPFVQDIAERMQCPPDFPAVGVMVAAGSVIGRQCAIRPKRHDNWAVVPNLWGAGMGRPSTSKSPSFDEALKPLKRLIRDALKSHEDESKDQQAAVFVAKGRLKKLHKDIEKAADTDDALKLGDEMVKLQDQIAVQITGRRYFTNDPTVEKLGELLGENPNGLLVFRDELTGWLHSLDREDRSNDRSFYLESWAGTSNYTYDRIGRGTIHIDAACVSVLGGIQPGPMLQYVAAATSNSAGADGLLQRFQLLVWPDDIGTWKNVDRWPDKEAKQNALSAFQYLAYLNPNDFEQCDDGGLPYLRFENAAQERFDEWHHHLKNVKLLEADSEAFESHLAKYPSLVPSLALITHLADRGSARAVGPVSDDALVRAINWVEYLETHARRVYAHGVGAGIPEARALATKIKRNELVGEFTPRELQRKGWRLLTRHDAVERAIATLADYDWLRMEQRPTGGRPTAVCVINPKLAA